MKCNQNFQFLRGKITARKARFVLFHSALAFSFPGAPIVIFARPISPLPFEWRILLVPTCPASFLSKIKPFPLSVPFVLSSFVVNVCKSSIKPPGGPIYFKPLRGKLMSILLRLRFLNLSGYFIKRNTICPQNLFLRYTMLLFIHILLTAI